MYGNVSAVSKGIGDANSRRRHVDITWFGPDTKSFPTSTAAVRKTSLSRLLVSSDHRLALATKDPSK